MTLQLQASTQVRLQQQISWICYADPAVMHQAGLVGRQGDLTNATSRLSARYNSCSNSPACGLTNALLSSIFPAMLILWLSLRHHTKCTLLPLSPTARFTRLLCVQQRQQPQQQHMPGCSSRACPGNPRPKESEGHEPSNTQAAYLACTPDTSLPRPQLRSIPAAKLQTAHAWMFQPCLSLAIWPEASQGILVTPHCPGRGRPPSSSTCTMSMPVPWSTRSGEMTGLHDKRADQSLNFGHAWIWGHLAAGRSWLQELLKGLLCTLGAHSLRGLS